VFASSSGALHTVAWIGAITAIVAATMGIVNPDIKKVLAYSTISQLGYMMLSLGSGAYVAAIFHLMNHAFFKALLFLGSGSVSHATNTFDMRQMGGLRKVMPFTFITFLIGSLSLSGIPPFSGYYSKDDILHAAWDTNKILFVLAFLVVFMTAFYMFRAIFLTFFGEFRGGMPHHDHWTEGWQAIPDTSGGAVDEHDGHDLSPVHPHESPWVMVLPLLVLAVPSVISWIVNYNGWFGDLLRAALPAAELDKTFESVNWGLAGASVAMAVLGILVAYVIYVARPSLQFEMGRILHPVYVLFSNKWYADWVAEDRISRTVVVRGVAFISEAFDTYVIDRVANGLGELTEAGGGLIKLAQSGQFQAYGFIFGAGVAVIAVAMMVAGR